MSFLTLQFRHPYPLRIAEFQLPNALPNHRLSGKREASGRMRLRYMRVALCLIANATSARPDSIQRFVASSDIRAT